MTLVDIGCSLRWSSRKYKENIKQKFHIDQRNNSKIMDTATPSGTEVEPGTPSSGNLYTGSDDMQTCEDDHTGTGYSDEDSEAETDSTQRQQAEEIGHLLKENLSGVSIIHRYVCAVL